MSDFKEKDHAAIGLKYAKDVVVGNVVAGKWIKLACKRHLDDLKHGKKRGLVWNPAKANEICNYIEALPHIKGEWARRKELLVLEPWQSWVVGTAFGWYGPDGTRRFRTTYVEVARKNAKSTVAAGVGLYMFTKDGEAGAEVYSAATTRDQAKIVFGVGRSMTRSTPDLQDIYGIEVNKHSLFIEETDSKFEALSAEGSSLDGLNIHCAVVDELHAHKTRAVFDVLETATGSRLQPMLFLITTAGFDRSGICYEQRTYVTKILDGVIEDDTYFGAIYTLDDEDDWTDPVVWPKANPNYGVSVYETDMQRLARKAQEMASATNNFLTKRLNRWVNADVAWMDMRAWDRQANKDLALEQFAGEKCYIALDLSTKVDLAAMNFVFPRPDGQYITFTKFYLPEDTIEESHNSQYTGWERSGYIKTTPGNTIDYDIIEDDLREAQSLFDIQEIPYDPFQATQLSGHMVAEGLPMVEVRPTVLNFSEPMKEVEAMTLDGRLTHDGNPVMTWMISNVVAKLDNKDNIYPRKERPENKIDGPVALIMNLGRAQVNANAGASVYNSRDLRTM